MLTSLVDELTHYSVSPYNELLSLEFLYSIEGSSLKKISAMTAGEDKLPSDALRDEFGFMKPDGIDEVDAFLRQKLGSFQLAINQTPTWPRKLMDSERPTPIIYFRGDIGLIERKSVSVVGSRKATKNGLARARRIARELALNDIVVVTGLAAGIDTEATKSAIENNGKTIGVIGTPIDEYYPAKNKSLQDFVARRHLLVSQVPFYKYSKQPFRTKRYYFPERNELMAAISNATVIVEASDTSGTLTQARACLHQKRPLFIMKSCVDNPNISWPRKYIEREGVYILEETAQIIDALSSEGLDSNG